MKNKYLISWLYGFLACFNFNNFFHKNFFRKKNDLDFYINKAKNYYKKEKKKNENS